MVRPPAVWDNLGMLTTTPIASHEEARCLARVHRVESVLATMRVMRPSGPGAPPAPEGLEETIRAYERELATLERRLDAQHR